MKGMEMILDILENATLAELKDELELLENHKDEYPAFFKQLLLAELAKRQENKKEVED